MYLQQVRPDPALPCQGRVSSIKLEEYFQPYDIFQGVKRMKPNEGEQLRSPGSPVEGGITAGYSLPSQSAFHPPVLLCVPEAQLLMALGWPVGNPTEEQRGQEERDQDTTCSLRASVQGSSRGCVPKPFAVVPSSVAHWAPPACPCALGWHKSWAPKQLSLTSFTLPGFLSLAPLVNSLHWTFLE